MTVPGENQYNKIIISVGVFKIGIPHKDVGKRYY